MMRTSVYNAGFAQVYNTRWAGFANSVAPRIREFFEQKSICKQTRSLLDICCGTGQLAQHFLEHGYRAVGLDISPAMLEHARKNCQSYIKQGLARFEQGDAADFKVGETFGLAVSTYDALNHLPDIAALGGCFRSTCAALVEDGWFIFDLNTRRGLRQWTGMSVQDMEDLTLITRGVAVDADDRMYTHITGFVRQEDGYYMRVDQTAFNSVFEMQAVDSLLRECGFAGVYCALIDTLGIPLDDPEKENRVFYVAQKPQR
jgi:SAM-dependent methyltransferase